MGDDKKLSGWATSLDDEGDTDGVQADIARKILAMNPALREAGVDTMTVLEKTKQHGAAQKGAAKAPAPQSGSAPVATTRVVDAVAEIKKSLAADERRLDAEIARLQQEKANLKGAALGKLADWLAVNDPDLRSPVTQATLEDEKRFLDGIGWSVKRYIELQKKRPKTP